MLALGASQAAWPPQAFLMQEPWHRSLQPLPTSAFALLLAAIFITADGLRNSFCCKGGLLKARNVGETPDSHRKGLAAAASQVQSVNDEVQFRISSTWKDDGKILIDLPTFVLR